MTINREHLAGLIVGQKECDRIAGDARGRTDLERKGAGECSAAIRALIAQAQAAPEAEPVADPVAWVPSAALAKLRNGSNNAPCVLTDGPAEFNETAVYLAPQHDAELVELLRQALPCVQHSRALRNGVQYDDLYSAIDAKLATLRHV